MSTKDKHDKFLFATCWVALLATASAFIIRVMLMDDWQIAFGLSETQKGEIFGAGLWPFGLSIVIFSLVIDKIGFKKSLYFALICHLVSPILMITATGYWGLYLGSILNGLAAGTVEAVINPAAASMYPKKKTKMLTILHAGWPAGFVLGGLAILVLGANASWQINAAFILIPTITYGLMLFKAKFPISERVAAGVSYKDMLREAGALGSLVVIYLLCMEINRVLGLGTILDTSFFDLPSWPMTIVLFGLVGGFFAYTRSLGRPMYIFLLLVMIILATTELGTDTWIKELMGPAMAKVGLDGGWVLIYTATIMTLLRFCIGPIERALRPLGVLLVSSIFAAFGLYFLSTAEGIWILFWATIYGTGQCFFWPVTLGLAAEQFPRGGALTLNAIAGVGMLGVGILGSQVLGFWQDINIDKSLQVHPAAYERLIAKDELNSVFGSYKPLNHAKVNEVNDKAALYNFTQSFVKNNNLNDLDLNQIYAMVESDDKFANDYAQLKILVGKAYDRNVSKPGESFSIDTKDKLYALGGSGFFVDAEGYNALIKDQAILTEVTSDAKRNAMKTVTVLPLIMALCYLGLILYFKFVRGGYSVVDINEAGEVTGRHKPKDEEIIAHAAATPAE